MHPADPARGDTRVAARVPSRANADPASIDAALAAFGVEPVATRDRRRGSLLLALWSLVVVILSLLGGVLVADDLAPAPEGAPVNANHCTDTAGAVWTHNCAQTTLLSPANGATGVSTTPTLQATYVGGFGGPGSVQWQLCDSSSCAGVLQTTTSGLVYGNGTTATWNPSTLTVGVTYWWRVRGRDTQWDGMSWIGPWNLGDWTATRSFTVGAGNAAPNAPGGLAQYRSNGTTAIASATWTNESTVVLKFNMSDPDPSQNLTPWVEVRTNTSWAGTCGSAGANMYSGPSVPAPTGGTPVLGTVTVGGLSNSNTYYWRACTADGGGLTSGWVTRGGAPDFRLDATAPTNPGAGGVYDVSLTESNDADWVGSATALAGSWGAGSDVGGSGVASYSYCFSSSSATCTPLPGTSQVNGITTPRDAGGTASPALANGATYYLCVRTVDGAGSPASTWRCSDGVTVDTANPSAPATRNDGPGADVDVYNSLSLPFNWSAGGDGAGSGVASYDVCLKTGAPTTNCTSPVASANVAGTSHTLAAAADGQHHVCVRSRDAVGNVSAYVCSDGVLLDTIAPSNPAQASIYDLSTTFSGDQDWSSDTVNLSMSWAIGGDAGSGVLNYDACFSTVTVGCTPISGTVMDGANTTRQATEVSNPMSNGTMYFACVRTRDNAGNVAAWQCSDGFRIDTSPPPAPATRNDGPGVDVATQSGGTVAANWSVAVDPIPGATQNYDWCINETTDCTTTPVTSGTTAATNMSTSSAPLTGGTTYYTCIRARDMAGQTSAYACTNGFQFLAAVSVTSTNPPTLPQGRKGVVVQVLGTGFQSGANVAVGGTGVTVTNVAFVNATRVDATIDVSAGAATTVRNVTVTNPDTSNGTGVGVLTIVAPTISISLSVLDYDDAARDAVAPYTFAFGTGLPGDAREVGPAGSGQATPGAAFIVTRSADTDTVLLASLTNLVDGGDTVPAGAVSWRVNGMGGAWTPFTVANATLDVTAAPPGPVVRSYDVRVDIPAAQASGSYSGTMTWTTVATP